MLHETRPNHYPQVPCDPPSLWAARRKGRLNTSRGIKPLAECVGSSLSDWAEILPVAQCSSDVAERVGLPQRFSDLSQNQWKAAFESVQKCADDLLLGPFYAAAAAVRDAPPTFITCRVGNDHRQVKALEVHAVAHPHEFQALVSQRVPVVLLTTLDEVDLLSRKWGLRHAKAAVRTEVSFAPSGPVIPLLDRFQHYEPLLLTNSVGCSWLLALNSG